MKPSRWPADFNDRVINMRSQGKTWREIGMAFHADPQYVRVVALKRGLVEAKKIRRFTPADDAFIRESYVNHRDLREAAAQIGCSYGVLCQRIFHYHRDLLNTVRSAHGTNALKRYGAGLLQHGATPGEAAAAIRSKIIEAKASARVAAIAAKQRRAGKLLEDMLADIAGGKPRNRAIFETRMLGLSLDVIGRAFGLTRERIRQICDQEAFQCTLAKDAEIPPSRDILLVASA